VDPRKTKQNKKGIILLLIERDHGLCAYPEEGIYLSLQPMTEICGGLFDE
jgi:hypothetical protein